MRDERWMMNDIDTKILRFNICRSVYKTSTNCNEIDFVGMRQVHRFLTMQSSTYYSCAECAQLHIGQSN